MRVYTQIRVCFRDDNMYECEELFILSYHIRKPSL